MDDFTMISVATADLGAACLGARSPWANVAAAGPDHALMQDLGNASGCAGARRRAVERPVQRMSVPTTQLPRFAAANGTELLPMTVTVTRKPKNVHKTRINAGGYGAMGPHPERERLA